MKKYIIREVDPDTVSFDLYFEDDRLKGESGDFCNNLFIIQNEGYGRISGFNMNTYKEIQDQAAELIDAFESVGSYYGYSSYMEAMKFLDIPYNSRKCHRLKEWAENADLSKVDNIAEFLTITTGKKWDTDAARGYCQGDYVDILYCPECYTNGVEAYGEVWLGAAKEFGVIELDENGEEVESCYGYIIADCQAWDDADYKRLVSEWAGIPEAESQLEMIENCSIITTKKYSYRIA